MDSIFSGMSRELDNNHATLAKKGRYMAHSAVANKTITPNAASNALAKMSIKVSVLTLRQDSQKPADAPLPVPVPPLLFSEEA